MPIKLPQVISLVAGTSVLIVLGSLYTFGALMPYLSSYLYYKGHQVSKDALTVVFTITIVMLNVGMPLGSFLSHRLSNRVISMISVTLLSGVVLITSFMTDFITIIIFYGVLNGLSIGVGYIAPVKNAYTHFQNRKGFAAGVCMSGFGFGSVIFNYILIFLINPNNQKIDHDTKHFPQDVANNVPYAFRIIALCYFGLGMAGALFISPEKRKEVVSLVTEEQVQPVKAFKKQTLPQIISRKKAYWLIISLACIVPYGMFVAFNYKEFAFQRNQYFQKEDHLVTLIGSIGIFINGFSRTIWGTLLDHFTFKKILGAMALILLICSASILWAVENTWTYGIVVGLTYCAYGGTFGIFPTQTVRIFGDKLGGNIYWIIFSGFSTAAVIQFVVHYVFATVMKPDEGFYYCIGIFVVLEIVGLIISQVISYEYLEDEKNMILQ